MVKEWSLIDDCGLWMVEVVLASGESIRASAKTAKRARKRIQLKLRESISSAA